MPNYNISLNGALAKIVEKEIKIKKYASRSEFFRDLVRRQYVHEEYTIEPITDNDPDQRILKKRKRGALFIPLKDLLA